MTKEEMENFFQERKWASHAVFQENIRMEQMYQAFKARFLEEQKMTPEELEEWKDKMVRK